MAKECDLAIIKIDADRVVGQVDPNIFGGFVEHLGRCVYGGIYEEGSELSDEHGYRKDVLQAVRDLRTPVLRWPGGNFVSGYHWTDGIGPREQRPRHMELAWNSVETNQFGTDEFMHYCQTLGIEPYICVNMGTGTIDEARNWVEYCNGTGDTYWANLRRQNGHAEPYNVKYWGLGNEVYGSWQIGHLDAEDYVKRAREFAKIMKWIDPTIKLVGCGEHGWTEWDRVVINGLAPYMDYYSLHLYTGSDDYYSNVFAPVLADFALESAQSLIKQARYEQKLDHPIYVAFDEWNVWYRQRSAESRLEEHYNLTDALAVSSYLNSFIRYSDTVKMANLAQLVNVIAPIFTSPEGMFLQTIYHPLRLFAEQVQEIALDVHVNGEYRILTAADEQAGPYSPHAASLGPFPLLDVAVTRDVSSKVFSVAVVNRDLERAHTTTLQFTDAVSIEQVSAYEINADNVTAENSFTQPEAVTIQQHQLTATGGDLVYTFPAHSVTMLHIRLA